MPNANQSFVIPSNLSAQAYLINQLAEKTNQPIWWFLSNRSDLSIAQQLYEGLSKILNNRTLPILNFPDDLSMWYETILSTSNKKYLLIIPQEYLNLALPSLKQFSATNINLKINQITNPEIILRQLVAAGFEPGPLPDRAGWFQKIGGRVTIAVDKNIWRLEFGSQNLEKIWQLNSHTGLVQTELFELNILPARLAAQPDLTLKQYAVSDNIYINAPAEYQIGQQVYITSPLKPSDYLSSVPLFGGQWEKIKEFFNTAQQNQITIKLLTTNKSEVEHNLASLNFKPDIYETKEELIYNLTGFHDLAKNIIFLTDRELTGLKQKSSRRTLASFDLIKPGDFLVHIDHGIGLCRGLTEQTIDNIKHDYLELEYAAGDKLFVPTEHTDRLSRYLGNPHPKLERLHAGSWYKVTQKVKTATLLLAQELLQIYATRELSKVLPYQSFPDEELLAASFPWALTPDQLKTLAEIKTDLGSGKPMDRLVCGDVGFGKTEIAIRTAFSAVLNAHQVALLAPTTILAQQHFDTFSNRLSNLGVNIALFLRAVNSKTTKNNLQKLKNGAIDIAIGTHALLSRRVKWKKLGLIVIDEEQKFGVKQKEQFKKARPNLHVLALSATPIPRTLNLGLAQVRDLSFIATPPLGRLPVATQFIKAKSSLIKKAIELELARGGQIYYLVPRVRNVKEVADKLTKLLPQISIGIIHGQLNPILTSKIMHDFDMGKTKILIATSIIENGLDLPNVNTLIVEGTELFGLADLYQLKGRVGRSDKQGYAYFLIPPKLNKDATARLEALEQAHNLGSGMSLALRDLELRGAGSILGKEQHGSVAAVGLHLFGELLAQAVEEVRTGTTLPTIPEVKLRLPLNGRLDPKIIESESGRIQLYQKLSRVCEPSELTEALKDILGRKLTDDKSDHELRQLLTTLEFKILAEKIRLEELSCQIKGELGRFTIKFLTPPPHASLVRLLNFDPSWHKTDSGFKADHMLTAGSWIPWLKQSLQTLT